MNNIDIVNNRQPAYYDPVRHIPPFAACGANTWYVKAVPCTLMACQAVLALWSHLLLTHHAFLTCIYADLEKACRPDCLLSTNTSTIDINLVRMCCARHLYICYKASIASVCDTCHLLRLLHAKHVVSSLWYAALILLCTYSGLGAFACQSWNSEDPHNFPAPILLKIG